MSDIKVSNENASVMATDLGGTVINTSCTLSGSRKNSGKEWVSTVMGNDGKLKMKTVKDVPIRFTFPEGVKILDVLKFASGGQSFMVAVQSGLRKKNFADVSEHADKGTPYTYDMYDLFNAKKGGFAQTPGQKKLRALEAMKDDIDDETYTALKAKYEKVVSEEKA